MALADKYFKEEINKILTEGFNDKDYEVLCVTGNNYYDEFKSLNLNKNIKIVPFVNNLKRLFKKTDILITRAGATTMSEIISYKVPSILLLVILS